MGCIGCAPWQNEGFAELNGSQSHNYGNDNYLATSIYSNLFALWVETIDYFIRPRKRTGTRAVTVFFPPNSFLFVPPDEFYKHSLVLSFL